MTAAIIVLSAIASNAVFTAVRLIKLFRRGLAFLAAPYGRRPSYHYLLCSRTRSSTIR